MVATALLLLATLAPIPIAGQTNAWWSGHPSVDGGKPIEAKEVTISLFSSKGCNTGGDGECQAVPLGGGFRGVRYTEMALVSLLGLFTLLLGIASLRVKRSRASFAKVVMVAAMISAIGSIVLLVMGTDIKSSKPVAVPMGPGLILFFIGTATAIGAAVVALLPYHEPLPRSLPVFPLPAQMPVAQPAAFDVEALMAQDSLRPAAGPERELMMGRPQSPGGALPGHAGPLVPHSGPQPLFQSAPRLRPLYEANGGFAPTAQPVQFPTRPPTPIGHAAVNAALGLDTPPKGIPTVGSPVIPLPPLQAPKLPPPTRTKTMSAAPPLPPIAKRIPPPPTMRPPPTTKPPPLKIQSGSPTMMSAAVPMPPQRPSADEMLKTANFEKSLATGDSTDNLDADLIEASDSAAKPIDMPFDTSTAENSTSAFQRDMPFDTSTAENSAKAFQADENTDASGGSVDDLETAAREKIENPEEPAPRGSSTAVELATRNSGTEVELNPAPRASASSVISSAAAPPAKTPKPSISTAPESLAPPPEGAPSSGPSPACPQCEAPMAWVEEHLRFFCKSCRMYF